MQKSSPLVWSFFLVGTWLASLTAGQEVVRLAADPALSPDGSQLAFSWRGDVWLAPIGGGPARQLTQHPAADREPMFSPDGRELAFISLRDGSPQVFVMKLDGGAPQQLTFHTAGYGLEGWFPDGQSLLTSGARDHAWKHADRFFRIRRGERSAEQLVFDDYGRSASISPDGQKILFTREGPAWWRKGYRGSQAQQIWLHDLANGSFTQILAGDTNASWPLWRPDGQAMYYVGYPRGFGELFEFDFNAKQPRPLTRFEDDSVAFPALSRDGSTLVFRHLFDFYRLRIGKEDAPVKIDLVANPDRTSEPVERRWLQTATDVTFSQDGLEVAFIAGGDLWVMDTELREPKRVTATPEEERDPLFSPDGDAIYFSSDREGQGDLWRAERSEPTKYWWQQESFKTERLTNDVEPEGNLKFNPDGTRLAYVRGRGDLWIMDPKSKEAKRFQASWNAPDYDWSPDGRWLAYATSDDDFNRDVWIAAADGSREPFNLSRHPNNDFSPRWSPDGKLLAFVGARQEDETDLFYVWLQDADDHLDRRDRALQKATEKLDKARKRPTARPSSSTNKPAGEDGGEQDPAAGGGTTSGTGNTATRRIGPFVRPVPPKVLIDFEGLHERVHRIAIPSSSESGLFWSPDGKKLAFTGSVDGKRGVYSLEFPENLKPTLVIAQVGSHATWLPTGQIVWLSGGLPGAVAVATNQATSYRFRAQQDYDVAKRNLAAFELAWRTMRDNYYDERLGNRNWDAIRRKYADAAAQAVDVESLATVIQLMLGELNGSHLGFAPAGGGSGRAGAQPDPVPEPPTTPAPADPNPPPSTSGTWRPTTKHLGVRFDPTHKGPGLKVRDVLPESPAAHRPARIQPGEIFLSVNGVTVDPSFDLTKVLNTADDDPFNVLVRDAQGNERRVALRPISWPGARSLAYRQWVTDNQAKVASLSGGKLGYLHVSGMNMSSFYKFEQELYSVGAGKDGLVIDVRENPGGSTTDHLLTALTQPTHAITVPRGGGPGYPQDRVVYAVWNKPIVVLCNQNSFSNAEIFAHAIKLLKRGRIVGVPTAGGVISTGAAQIMDVGTLRLPFRGWYHRETGEDLELNGAVPDVLLWPAPGELTAGKDTQLLKAVELLQEDVKQWLERPRPKLRKATER